MYALIYDEHNLDKSRKQVLSVHESREESEKALEKRKEELDRKVWECNTRIVWTEKAVNSGDAVGPGEYATWGPSEDVPEGELHSDSD